MTGDVSISAIVPVYNGSAFLAQSLPPLMAMLDRGELAEVIVVDDGSTDDSAERSRVAGARVVPSGGRLGPGGARNVAARQAGGDVLWFVDADVVVHDDAARKLAEHFATPGVAAVFGSYDDSPAARGFFSQYKNLAHHYQHQCCAGPSRSFWAGCGAIRKSAFDRSGGFDARLYARPSIEDIELGHRLATLGSATILDPSILCTHLKVWRLRELLMTDIFCRALPWSRLILSNRAVGSELNVRPVERWRAVLALLFVAAPPAALVYPLPAWLLLFLCAAAIVANSGMFAVFRRRNGLIFAIGAVGFHQFFYLYGGAAFAWCWMERLLKRH